MVLGFVETKFRVLGKPMNYCSRCHTGLAAPVGLSGNIHCDRCAPSIKEPQIDLATKTYAEERGRHKITSVLLLLMALWAFRKLDFNHTRGSNTNTLTNPERCLMQPSLNRTGLSIIDQGRKSEAQNIGTQFCAIAGLIVKCRSLWCKHSNPDMWPSCFTVLHA